MLTEINPKLPMRDKTITRDFYINKLGFKEYGSADYDGYLMIEKDRIQIHFFEFKEPTLKKIMVKFILEQTILTNITNHY